MKVDIVIRARNNAPLTAACIKSIRDNTPREDYRIILVDDGSMPPLHTLLEDTGEVYVLGSRSSGAVTATNRGLALSLLNADTAYVAVFDNDTSIPDGDTAWLDRFIAELEEYPGTAAVGATGTAAGPQHPLAVPQTYTAAWGDESRGGRKDNPQIAKLVSFACLFIKDAVKECGFWDERYNPGNWEDSDYAVTLRDAGWTVRVARSVYIHHRCHTTFGPQLGRLLRANEQKFYEKWGIGKLFDMRVVSAEHILKVAETVLGKGRVDNDKASV